MYWKQTGYSENLCMGSGTCLKATVSENNLLFQLGMDHKKTEQIDIIYKDPEILPWLQKLKKTLTN